MATPNPKRSNRPAATPCQPVRSPSTSSSSITASTAPIGSSTRPSPSSTSPRGSCRRICCTRGFTTVGPVAKTMALNTAANDQFKPASQWAARKAPPKATNRRTATMRSTAVRSSPPGSRSLRPPSNSTRLTSRPTTVPRLEPKSSGSTQWKPARPTTRPLTSSSTTACRLVSLATSCAVAPEAMVMPQSRLSRSALIQDP